MLILVHTERLKVEEAVLQGLRQEERLKILQLKLDTGSPVLQRPGSHRRHKPRPLQLTFLMPCRQSSTVRLKVQFPKEASLWTQTQVILTLTHTWKLTRPRPESTI